MCTKKYLLGLFVFVLIVGFFLWPAFATMFIVGVSNEEVVVRYEDCVKLSIISSRLTTAQEPNQVVLIINLAVEQ